MRRIFQSAFIFPQNSKDLQAVVQQIAVFQLLEQFGGNLCPFNCGQVVGVVQVGANEIAHIVLDEPRGHLFHAWRVCAEYRQNVDLEQYAAVVKLLHQAGFVVPVDVALGVRQNGFVAVDLHLENRLVEVAVQVGERALEKQLFVVESEHWLFAHIVHKIVVDVIFGGHIELNINRLASDFGFQRFEFLLHPVGRVVVEAGHKVRGDNQLFVAQLAHPFDEADAVFQRLCPVIDVRNQVRVHIARQSQLAQRHERLRFFAEQTEKCHNEFLCGKDEDFMGDKQTNGL